LSLQDYGFTPSTMSENMTSVLARVTAVHKGRYTLVCEHCEAFGQLKTKEYYGSCEEFPTVGDFVLIIFNPYGDSQIIATLHRNTFFSRRDPTPGRGEQAVAANFDYVFIMQSLNHDFNIKRTERYLTLAWQSGAVPVILLTKADLVKDYSEQLRQIEKIAAGVSVYAVSAKSGYGLVNLAEYLKPRKTIVFLGSSGVGKSSLVNALAGETVMAVNEIREDDSKGRHTTNHRQLIMLRSGVMVIDTPGMRELGMWDVSSGLGDAFGDVEQYLDQCKFSDCKHKSEPGCAVKAAMANGQLSRERWQSYLSLKSEAKYSNHKTAYKRKKQQSHKDNAKMNKKRSHNS
jgi:ribosome biogenesis GTPase / thiamine phosphate phosphatase